MISVEILRRYPCFAGMTGAQLNEVAMLSCVRTFESGEELFREGNTATHLLLLMFGEIHIVYQLGDGREVIADTLVAGDTLAWSSLLEPHRLTASGVAHKAGSVLEIEATGLRKMCAEDQSVGYRIVKEIAKTLRDRLSAMRIQVAASVPVPARG